jgi:hypothetical protein
VSRLHSKYVWATFGTTWVGGGGLESATSGWPRVIARSNCAKPAWHEHHWTPCDWPWTGGGTKPPGNWQPLRCPTTTSTTTTRTWRHTHELALDARADELETYAASHHAARTRTDQHLP